MSEPQTSAKVIIHTVKGRIDVELWAKEKPVHTRRFLEVCRRGILIDESFDKLSSARNYLMISKVDDVGASRGSSLEHNARIRWRTGSFGWDSAEQKWFITLAPLNEDNGKVAIGKIVDDSIYSLRKIVDDSEVESNGKLLYPATIRKIEVTVPYFDDLPPEGKLEAIVSPKQSLRKVAKVKISFSDDDDDEDDEPIQPMKRMKIKMPATIAESRPVEPVSADSGSESESQEEDLEEAYVEQEGSGRGAVEQEFKKNVDEPRISDRERETLKLLAHFEEKTKDKTILKR